MSAQLQESTCSDCGRPVRLVLARSGGNFAIDPLSTAAGAVILVEGAVTIDPRNRHWSYRSEPVGAVVAPWLLAQLPAGRPRFTLHDSTCPVPFSARYSKPGSSRDRNAQGGWATLRTESDCRERARLAAREKRLRDRDAINLADAVAALEVWETDYLEVTSDRAMKQRRVLAAGYGWTLGQLTEAIVLAEQARARGEVA